MGQDRNPQNESPDAQPPRRASGIRRGSDGGLVVGHRHDQDRREVDDEADSAQQRQHDEADPERDRVDAGVGAETGGDPGDDLALPPASQAPRRRRLRLGAGCASRSGVALRLLRAALARLGALRFVRTAAIDLVHAGILRLAPGTSNPESP